MHAQYSIYSLSEDWGSEQYSKLLDLANQFGGSFVLVKRSALYPEGDNLIYSLSPFAIYEKRGVAWPGTRLLSNTTADIYKFSVNEDSLKLLRLAASSVWDWQGPRYPEDLSFLRQSGTPWFVSITHEHDVFFKLLEMEQPTVETAFGMPLIYQCVDQCPDERYY
jgi:hypothetical protein